jgi:hypothetical protein
MKAVAQMVGCLGSSHYYVILFMLPAIANLVIAGVTKSDHVDIPGVGNCIIPVTAFRN